MFEVLTSATTHRIHAAETLISELQQQLEESRQELAKLQQQQQAEQTAKSAAETALEMVRKARKLVQIAYGDRAKEEFNHALVEDEPVNELPSGEPQAAEASDEINPVPDSPTSPAIEVIAVEIQDQPEENGHNLNPALDFSKISWSNLRKLATYKGVATRGMNKDSIQCALISMGLSQKEIDSAAA